MVLGARIRIKPWIIEVAWYASDAWGPDRANLLAWILKQPRPGDYAVALIKLQAEPMAIDLTQLLNHIEKDWLRWAMKQSDNNISAAARRLMLKRTTFWQRLKRFGLSPKRSSSLA